MIRIGTSGYLYKHWRGVLYPARLAEREWLPWYARFFDTVELNATFYRLPTAEAAARWRAVVPDGFAFAVKGSRYLTHMKRLLDAGEGLARFYAPIGALAEKLRVTLWQLPPHLKPDPARLEAFLARVPEGRHAVEARNEGWYTEEVADVLDRHGAAFCEHDLLPRGPPRITGGWRYLRFHGRTGKYDGRYGADALRPHADDLRAWSRGGRVAFVYFNNDLGGHAVHDALTLLRLCGEDRPALDLPAHAPA